MSKISIPNPFDSDKEYQRYHHYDLADMEMGDLQCELFAVRYHLWLLKSERSAHILGFHEQKRRVAWHRERISRIEAELSKCKYATRQPRGQFKPRLAEGVKL